VDVREVYIFFKKTYLHGDSVGVADHVTPISTAHWDDGDLSEDDGPADGCGDFLGALHAKTYMAIRVSDDDKGLEAGALPSTGLLLHGHDLHNLCAWGE
jgi:hypothetical protein